MLSEQEIKAALDAAVLDGELDQMTADNIYKDALNWLNPDSEMDFDTFSQFIQSLPSMDCNGDCGDDNTGETNFEMFDTDKNGKLSEQEIKVALDEDVMKGQLDII
jgi:Ca2+-binding EF-hand superfamily protein